MEKYGHFDNPFIIDQIGLRERMGIVLKKHPRSMWEVAKEAGITPAVVKKFGDGQQVGNKVALKLQKYINELENK